VNTLKKKTQTNSDKKGVANKSASPSGQAIEHFYTCFKEKVEDGWSFEGEMHDFWEMVYVTDGEIYALEDGRIYKLVEGDIIIHKPMEFHRLWCEHSPHTSFMVISFYSKDDVFLPLGDKVMNMNVEKRSELENLYQYIHNVFDANLYVESKTDNSRDLINERVAYLRFELFLLSLLNTKKSTTARQHSIGAQNYKLIIDTMNENINKNLTIEELAQLCNLSVPNLKKTFKKYGSGGVMKYFNRMKIKRAVSFIRSGKSIANVSDGLGFSSQNYFSVVFKRETGILPSEFKKNDLPNW